jgi:hypothetical protein
MRKMGTRITRRSASGSNTMNPIVRRMLIHTTHIANLNVFIEPPSSGVVYLTRDTGFQAR